MTCSPQVDRDSSASERVARAWTCALAQLERELPRLTLEMWIHPIVPEFGDGRLRLGCPTSFQRDRVRERYLPRLEALLAEAHGTAVAVDVCVTETAAPEAPPAAPVTELRAACSAPAASVARHAVPAPRAHDAQREPRELLPAAAEASPDAAFDGFVAGPANALAREACLALAAGRQLAVSPLYIHGPPGLGKSRLAAAVARAARARGARVVLVSAEQFTNELMASIRSDRTGELKRRYREECDVLIVEDVQFVRGKAATQHELLHTLEHLARRRARVLLTADRLPREIPDLEPRLASRMASGLCAELEPPDAALRRAILIARARELDVALPPACLERLVDAPTSSVRDLEAVLVQVVASASLLRRPIDPALVDGALRKALPGAAGRLDPERVAELVAARFGTTAAALASRSRRREVLVPRQLAMALCARFTDASLAQIGRAFGRNHPSVANALRAVERALARDARLRARYEALAAEIAALEGLRRGPRRAERPRPPIHRVEGRRGAAGEGAPPGALSARPLRSRTSA